MVYNDKKTGRAVEVFTPYDRQSKPDYTGVEVTKNGNWVAEIGCWFENRKLVDYDGVFCLPMSVIRALRAAGWSVPREYERDVKSIN